jgi:hypothetical protein
MNYSCIILTKVFKKLNLNDFFKIQGIGVRTANHLYNIRKDPKIYNNQQLKTIIQSHNRETNNKIRYNFITNTDLVITKDGFIYKLMF